MDANMYQAAAMRTMNKAISPEEKIVNAALGLAGESGEFADMIKKHRFHGHDLDTEELVKELGDIMWYVALACEALDVPLSSVMRKNILKLAERYPEGFDEERSKNRV